MTILRSLLMALCVQACGQTGPLYLPDEKPPIYVPPEEPTEIETPDPDDE